MKVILAAVMFGVARATTGKYCLTDTDCSSGGYCMNDSTKTPMPVYLCHGGSDTDYCRGDGDCEGSYCSNDPTKTPVADMYLCHVGEKPESSQLEAQTCEADTDCQTYCQNDPTKTPPYTCHSIGGTCNTDDDCTGYCMDDPTKTPPYYCHMPNAKGFADVVINKL